MSGDDLGVAIAQNDSRFRAIFASEPECVKIIGSDCSLIDMNPAGLRMIDAVSIESVRGRNLLGLIDPAYHEPFRESLAAVFRGESVQLQFEVVGLRGRRLWMDQSAAPLFDPNNPNRVVEMVAVTRDITAQREAEAEALRAKLAEAISRSKSEFLANVSHELKTPLNHILGYSELLLEAALDEGRQRDAVDHQRVLGAANRLLSMINQMLAVAQIDASRHKVCVEECDVGTIIHDAVTAIKTQADAHGNEITIEISDERGLWNCDSSKIDQCLRSLLSNAAKFTSNGVISVRASRDGRDGASWLQLEVIDTGQGIDESRLAAIFEPFSRTDSGPPERNEIGLGLAVARQIARLMGGDLTVASTTGQGSRFTLRVPAEFHLDTAFPSGPSWTVQSA